MFVNERTIDDLLLATYSEIASSGQPTDGTRAPAKQLSGAFLKLTNPRSRLSLSLSRGLVFSCLGEFLWYMKGASCLSMISYYIPKYAKESEDGATVYGAYGPRILDKSGVNQLQNAIQALQEKSSTKRAVIQIFDAADIAKRRREIPCTCSLQFLRQGDQLDLTVFMRSNDAYRGLPHDLFAFTLLQEYVARLTRMTLGHYNHFVGSLHLYIGDESAAKKYIDEGYQPSGFEMPEMPQMDAEDGLEKLLVREEEIRLNTKEQSEIQYPNDYWRDLEVILKLHRAKRDDDLFQMRRLASELTSNAFENAVLTEVSKLETKNRKQLKMDFE
jgi:thymidylate synthase